MPSRRLHMATLALAVSHACACNTMLDLADFEVSPSSRSSDASMMPAPAPLDAARVEETGSDDRVVALDATIAAPDSAGAGGDAATCDHPVPEDCTNGVDDDCNGLVDCADPACGAFRCAPPTPTGWFGPVAFWEAASGATTPACPLGYAPLIDARAGPQAAPATCTCTCAPSAQACVAMGTFHPDQTCANAVCATVTPAPSGVCTPLPQNVCGSGGSFDLAMIPSPSGACLPQVVPTIPPLDWALDARVCLYSGAVSAPGGCAAGESCLTRPASPYGSTICVYSSADPARATCPVGYDANPPFVVYSGSSDGRACGVCDCSALTGGSCEGSIQIFADSACAATSPSVTYLLGTSCQSYNGVNVGRGAVAGHYTVGPGGCSVKTAPLPVGSASPSRPTTVCCL